MQRLLPARRRYAEALRSARKDNSISKITSERKKYEHKLRVMTVSKRAGYLDRIRRQGEERERDTGKVLLSRYKFLLPEEKLALHRQVRRVERANLENLSLQRHIRTGARVCVASAPGAKKGAGLLGRVGTVEELRRAEGTCVVKGLDKDRTYTIPLTNLQPLVQITDPTTRQTTEVLLTPSTASRDLKTQLRSSTNARGNSIHRLRVKEGLDGSPLPGSGLFGDRPKRQAVDTPMQRVQKPSFEYKLLEQPMPESVIDELRAKYSEYRRRWVNEDGSISRQTKREFAEGKREEERLRQERASGGYVQGGVLGELGAREKRRKEEREAREGFVGERKEVPDKEVLAFLGKRMMEAGVALPSTSPSNPSSALLTEKDTTLERTTPLPSTSASEHSSVQRKAIAVAARERDERLLRERKQKREESRMYWPVKGWKEKQRVAAKQALEAQKMKEHRKKVFRDMLPLASRPGGGAGMGEARA